MPASWRARSSSFPAGPTKGRPRRSSMSPGCSPTKAMRASAGPSPKTVPLLSSAYRSQPRQDLAASASPARSASDGTNSSAPGCGEREGTRQNLSLPDRLIPDVLVPGERLLPLDRVVDDALGLAPRQATGQFPRLVDDTAGHVGQLRHVATDVVAVRVELLSLQGRVEDPEER